MKEINIEFTSDIDVLSIVAEFCWENALFFNLSCTLYTQDTQEYDIVFPEKDYSKNLVIKLNSPYDSIIKEKIVVWVDKPDKNKTKLVEELKKECVYYLQKEMQNSDFSKEIIYQIFENENIKLK